MGRNCVNSQYTYQEFLLECPYHRIQITDYVATYQEELSHYNIEYNLFDFSAGSVRRQIQLSELDRIVDTEDDFLRFIQSIRWIDELVIVDDRPHFDNPILSAYSINTLKAYLYRINHAGIVCCRLKQQNVFKSGITGCLL